MIRSPRQTSSLISSLSQHTRAFTLVELLAVMAIATLMAALATPAVSLALRGTQLTQAANLMAEQIDFARQTALSKNRPVEVRLYNTASTEPNTGRYRGIQLFEINEAGVALPIGKVRWLPGSISIDSGARLSSLIGAATTASVPTLVTNPTDPLADLGTAYQMVSFRFLPNGSTTLTPRTDRWFFTLHQSSDGDKLEKPGKNFFTLQIDAGNGHLRTFRP